MNLSELSFDELKRLQYDVEEQIAILREKEIAEFKKFVADRAKHLDLGNDFLDALNESTRKAKGEKKKVAQKFFNPKDHYETWSGRGRKPLWFVAALNEGVQENEMLI